MIGRGAQPGDPVVIEMKSILKKSKSDLSIGFLLWFYQRIEGLEDYLDDNEKKPLQEIEDITLLAANCDSEEMKTSFFLKSITRMHVLRYRAKNSDGLFWTPLSSSFREFLLVSDRITIWISDDRSQDARIHEMIRERFHHFTGKHTNHVL
jgi:hypothetical protein